MPFVTTQTGTHTCGHCRGKGTIGFWLWKRACKPCQGNGKIFVTPEQVTWPHDPHMHTRTVSPIRRDDVTDVEAIPPDARPFMHERPRRPPRR